MTVTTLSSREFNQDTGKAKKAALDGPVVITDRGKPSHVLMSYAEYARIQTGRKMTIAESLFYPGVEMIDIAFERSRDLPREVDFD